MSRIVLASGSADLQQRVQEATAGGSMSLWQTPFPQDPAQLLEPLAKYLPPDAVVLDPGPAGIEKGLELAARFDHYYPAASVVLISDRGDITLPAMRAGVRDVLHPAADIADVRVALERAVRASTRAMRGDTALAGPPPVSGRVISVVSPKGGVGKTTVATNLAVGLTALEPTSTVLVDLDLQFGDVASSLDLGFEYALPDAVRTPAGPDTMILKTFLTQHATGLYVLCGSDSPADADAVSPQQVGDLLVMLASEFRYVVVDTGPGLSEHTLAAMDQSTDLVLVTSSDVPGVRGLRKELQMLQELDLVPDARHVLLNFVERNGDLSQADVEATIGADIDLLLPRSKAAAASMNRGVPLLQGGGRDPLTKQLQRLVDRFAPAPAPSVAPDRQRGRHYLRRSEAS
ncbi:AAA family ATPase [Cumulibacter manganitolerans]|uniref:AAA family ATPase n=1 Tax=Cumulibacter manganitolerans TaxID=1884992 RepID=UPI001296672D|nr:AAA family ATPase [Cumulibacter manganitolerans]